jgi:hypothetical protein
LRLTLLTVRHDTTTSLDLLKSLRAASTAIEYERRRLAVTVVMDCGDFADRLDRAIEKSGLGQAKLIEHQPTAPKAPTEPVVTPAQMNARFSTMRRRA